MRRLHATALATLGTAAVLAVGLAAPTLGAPAPSPTPPGPTVKFDIRHPGGMPSPPPAAFDLRHAPGVRRVGGPMTVTGPHRATASTAVRQPEPAPLPAWSPVPHASIPPVPPGAFPPAAGSASGGVVGLRGRGPLPVVPPPVPPSRWNPPVAPPFPAPSATPNPYPPPPAAASQPGRLRLEADAVRYDRKAQQAYATGHVTITQQDTVITTEQVHYDQAAQTSYIDVPVEVVQDKPPDPRTTLRGDKLVDYHREKRVVVDGHVWLLRAGNPAAQPAGPTKRERLKTALKREDSVITADHMQYWTDRKDAQFDDHVVAYQREKKATGDHAFMDKAKQTTTLRDHVRLVQIKGDWLVRNQVIDTSKPDTERDKALKDQATIDCDQLVIDQVTNDAVATGQVVTVKQKGRVATSKRAVYTDATQQIVLTEDVKIQQANGDWLTSEKAVFHTDSDRFEALSGGGHQVETTFDLDSGGSSTATGSAAPTPPQPPSGHRGGR